MELEMPRLRLHDASHELLPLFPADCEYSQMKVRRGATLMHSGETPGGIIYVRSGLVKAFRASKEGREIAVAYMAAGEICLMSILCALAGRPSPVELVAMEECEVWMLPKRELLRLQATSPEAQQFIADVVLARTTALIGSMEEIAFLPIRVRLERFLQAYHRFENGERCLSMTHDELARSLGTSREVVSRLLLEMASEGKVELRRGNILLRPYYSDEAIAAA